MISICARDLFGYITYGDFYSVSVTIIMVCPVYP